MENNPSLHFVSLKMDHGKYQGGIVECSPCNAKDVSVFYLKTKKAGRERTILVDPVTFEATSHLNMV